jgi:hypothetical protein
MLRIHARGVVTMVQHAKLGRTVCKRPRESVCQDHLSLPRPERPIACAVEASSPQPTGVRLRNLCPEPICGGRPGRLRRGRPLDLGALRKQASAVIPPASAADSPAHVSRASRKVEVLASSWFGSEAGSADFLYASRCQHYVKGST